MRSGFAPLRSIPADRPAATPPAVVSPTVGGPACQRHDATETLRERVAMLERAVSGGGLDRKIPLEEIAARLNHAPATLRAWARDPKRVSQYRLDLLLVPSPLPSRELYTTPRLLAQWEAACREQWARVLFGHGRKAGEQLVGEATR